MQAVLWSGLATGCGPRTDVSETAAMPQARKLLGEAAPHVPLTLSDDERATLLADAAVRRERAWQVVANFLRPVAVGDATVPAWATWYGADDMQRLFHKLYGDLGPDGRRARLPFSAEMIDDALRWNAVMVDELPNWPATRYDAWRAGVDNLPRYHGLSGLSRTLFAPAAARHLLGNYAGVKDCVATADAAPFSAPGRSADNFSLCLTSEFPSDAAIVKSAWRRRDFGMQLPVYDTDPVTLATKLADPTASWGTGERQADPGDDDIYTMTLDGGASYRLAGLHIMTKDVREWLWITLWWSDTPNEDFGADRPPAVAALGAPWNQYKMCVVTGFVDGGGDAAAPSYSWCSNPYLEAGAGNHRSNCMGCHQHGGGTIASEAVLSDEARFPGQGRARVRENFPGDYLWSIGRDPERLGPWMGDVVTHYDLHDPRP